VAGKTPEDFMDGCIRMQRLLEFHGDEIVNRLRARNPLALRALLSILHMGDWAEEVLEELVEEDALVILESNDVIYPPVHEQEGDGEIDPGPWPAKGLLKHFGYSVAADGPTERRRREILTQFLARNLRGLKFDSEYLAEWGEPRSCQRLQKIVYSLSSFANNALRKADAPTAAVRKWQADIDWIKAGNLDQRRCIPTIQFPRVGAPR